MSLPAFPPLPPPPAKLQNTLHRSSSTPQRNALEASLSDSAKYWEEAATGLDWVVPPSFAATPGAQVLETRGSLSIYHNLVTRHCQDQLLKFKPALIYDSPVALNPKGQRGVKIQYSFLQLDSHVRAVALKLLQLDVTPGDVVLIYMPMVPEAVFAMLACARVGAVHSVVFGGFAAIALSSYKPPHLILLNRPELPIPLPLASNTHLFPTPLMFKEAELKGMPEPVVLSAEKPLYLLYTSGSTGTPKGVVRSVGGHAVALKHTMDVVLGVKKGDVMFAASDIGWVVGHTFIIYGPLLQGCTTVLYEGKPIMPKTDGAGAFWRIIQEYKVNALYTAPTAIRAIRKEDPEGKLMKKYNIKSLRDVFLAGERCDPDTAAHFTQKLGVNLRDNFWQTETGTPITGPCVMTDGLISLPKLGSCGPPTPGYDVRVLVPPKQHQLFATPHDQHLANESDYAPPTADADETPTSKWVPASPGEVGSLVIKLPLPPGCFPTLWNNHAGYLKSYFERFPGYYDLTDQGFIDADGYVTVLGRSDDVLNVAGHRLSSGGMEEILMSAHGHQVAECAVVGVHDPLKTEKPVGFVVLKDSATGAMQVVEKELIKAVREKMGAVACFDRVVFVKRLPKTRSGKILRRSLRSIANGEAYTIPATIEDPESLHEVARLLGNKTFKSSKL
ncbi:hypothetical protein HDU98_008591 [Podochytrium sp. JEL0797]|nr:hypothetical protein HDU98_008591 [Podochytrium sp. JEL0797]